MAAGVPTINEGRISDCFELISLPSIDLRSFATDELLLVAHFSGHFPDATSRDIVVPTLDRRVFNESAGSRKQTYNNPGSNKHSNRGVGKPAPTVAAAIESSNAIIGASSASPVHLPENGARDRTKDPTPIVATRSRVVKSVARVITQGKRRLTVRSEEARQFSLKKEPRSGAGTLGGETRWVRKKRRSLEISGSSEDSLRTDSGQKKSGRGASTKRRREGRSSRRSTSGVSASDELAAANGPIDLHRNVSAGTNVETFSRKKLRQTSEPFDDGKEAMVGRSRKRNASEDDAAGSLIPAEEGSVRARKRSGRAGLVVADPLLPGGQVEFDQRAEGLARERSGEADMADRLEKMEGTWVSCEKTRKIVDATGFPVGWTVRVGLSRKDGRMLFEYRDWRSPEGKLWPSFKDATAFLLSTIRDDSTSKIVPPLKPSRAIARDQMASVTKKGATNLATGEGVTKISRVVANVHSRDAQSELRSDALDDTARGKGEVLGVCFCNQQMSGLHLDCMPIVDGIPNMTQSAIERKVTSDQDPSVPEEAHRKVLDTEETLRSRQSAHTIRCWNIVKGLVEQHCCKHMTKSCESSQVPDSGRIEKRSNFDSTFEGMECIEKSGLSSSVDAICCRMLVHNDGFGHKCSLCGMMFSTLLELRRHLKRAKHLKYLQCEVCERHFQSRTLLVGHRVKMGHPRVTKVPYCSTNSQAQGSEPVSASGSISMLNIVLGLLSDTRDCNDGLPFPVDQLGEMPSENLKEARDVLGNVKGEFKKETGKSCDETDMFECKSCRKVLYHHSKYSRQLAIHLKHRRKSLAPGTLPESASENFPSRLVDLTSNPCKLFRRSTKADTADQCTASARYSITKSVFWKLLDDRVPSKGVNPGSDMYKKEATVEPPAPCTNEEAADTEGSIDFASVSKQECGSLEMKLSPPDCLRLLSDTVLECGLPEQESHKIEPDVSRLHLGPQSSWQQVHGKQVSLLAGEHEECCVCGEDWGGPSLLFCSWCERRFHLGCLGPTRQVIPDFEGVCPTCWNSDIQAHDFRAPEMAA